MTPISFNRADILTEANGNQREQLGADDGKQNRNRHIT